MLSSSWGKDDDSVCDDVGWFTLHDENKNIPTALDVYEGKTTLEITYRDSIPVDSVVVFKEEFKK